MSEQVLGRKPIQHTSALKPFQGKETIVFSYFGDALAREIWKGLGPRLFALWSNPACTWSHVLSLQLLILKSPVLGALPQSCLWIHTMLTMLLLYLTAIMNNSFHHLNCNLHCNSAAVYNTTLYVHAHSTGAGEGDSVSRTWEEASLGLLTAKRMQDTIASRSRQQTWGVGLWQIFG